MGKASGETAIVAAYRVLLSFHTPFRSIVRHARTRTRTPSVSALSLKLETCRSSRAAAKREKNRDGIYRYLSAYMFRPMPPRFRTGIKVRTDARERKAGAGSFLLSRNQNTAAHTARTLNGRTHSIK